MKKSIVFILMMVFTALDAMAHNPRLTLGKMFPAPKEWTGSAWGKDPLEWNILDYQHGLVTAYCKDKNRAHFIRFDEEFNIKSSFSAKVLPEAEELSHRIYDQKIHFILQEHEDIVHLVFDEQSLQLLKQETLFKMKTTKYAAVEVKYAEHGDFAAIVVRYLPKKELFDVVISHDVHLYDMNFQPIANGVFDKVKYPIISFNKRFAYASAWTVTDDGKVVLASVKVAEKPKSQPRFGKSGGRMDVAVLSHEGMRTWFAKDIPWQGLPVGFVGNTTAEDIAKQDKSDPVDMNLKTGTIFDYDGKQMKLYLMNMIFDYDFDLNEVTPMKRFGQSLNPPFYTSGASNYINTKKDGIIIEEDRGYAWIKPELEESFIGYWGDRDNVTKLFQKRFQIAEEQFTFYYQDRYYLVEKITKFKNWIAMENTFRLRIKSIDKDNKMTETTLDTDLTGKKLRFFRISDGRYLFWQQFAKQDKQLMQCLGFLEF